MLAPTIPTLRPVHARWALCVAAVVVFAAILYEGHGGGFFYDDWGTLQSRRGDDPDTVLRAANGHCSIVNFTIFKAIFAVWGMHSPPVLRTATALVHLGIVAALFLLLRRRVSEPTAAGLAFLYLVLGRSDQNLYWWGGQQLALLGGVWALVGLDRDTRGGRVLACGALIFALGSSSTGIPFMIGAVIEVLARRDRLQRLWIIAVPAVLYIAWYIPYGGGSGASSSNVALMPPFVTGLAGNAAGAMLGLDVNYGRVVAIVLAAGLVWWTWQGGRWNWRMVALFVTVTSYWAATGISRAAFEPVETVRYTSLAVACYVLLIGEVFRRASAQEGALEPAPEATAQAPAPDPRVQWQRLGAVSLVLLWCAFSGWSALHNGMVTFRSDAKDVVARLGAVALSGNRVPFGLQPVPRQPSLIAGKMTKVQEDNGRLALTVPELLRANPAQKDAADDTLRMLKPLTLGAASKRRCTAKPLSITVPEGGRFVISTDTPIGVTARRFGATPGPPLVEAPAGTTIVRIADDAAENVPWTVQPMGPVAVCPLP